jgi:hypothetical protein
MNRCDGRVFSTEKAPENTALEGIPGRAQKREIKRVIIRCSPTIKNSHGNLKNTCFFAQKNIVRCAEFHDVFGLLFTLNV